MTRDVGTWRNCACAPGSPSPCVIYLDIDGVLHHEALQGSFRGDRSAASPVAGALRHFQWADHLERLLAAHPGVALVLSSHWCVRPGIQRTLRRLPIGLRARVIGCTLDILGSLSQYDLRRFCALSRGEQVWADVCARQPRHWLALDDNVLGWPAEAASHLIPCDGDVGISSALTQSLVREALGAWAALDACISTRYATSREKRGRRPSGSHPAGMRACKSP